MQRLRRLPQGNAHDVPDLHRHRRGDHEHARPGQRDPRGAGTARRGQRRPAALRGAGRGAEQLPLLQGLHDRMPVQRQPGPAEGRAAERPHTPGRVVLARAAGQLRGFAGPARLRHAPAGQRRPGLAVRAQPLVRRRWASPGSGRCRVTPGSASTVGSRAASARSRSRAGGSCCGTTPLCAITSRTSASRR